MLWLWELRDIGIIGVGLLISVLALTQTGIALPLVLTAVYAFLSIRFDGTSISGVRACRGHQEVFEYKMRAT